MEISVGFTDKETKMEEMERKGYLWMDTGDHLVYWPSKGVVTEKEIQVNYEIKPWLSTFVVKGIKPKVRKNPGRDYTREMKAILQLAQRKGSVTSGQVRPMCRLTSRQTTDLLHRITEGGYLEKHGTGRGTWYEPTGKKL